MTRTPQDISIEEAVRQCDEMLAINPRMTFYFKFTCAGCGKRKTFDVPNVVYRTGECDECGHVTDLEESGVGYMLVV